MHNELSNTIESGDTIDSKVFLNDSWDMYFHDPYDNNWDDNSYKMLGVISSVDDYINYFKAFK